MFNKKLTPEELADAPEGATQRGRITLSNIARVSTVATEAQRAYAEGRSFYTPKFNTPSSRRSINTMVGSIAGWSEMLEAVENCGFQLVEWSTVNRNGNVEAYPVFRRR